MRRRILNTMIAMLAMVGVLLGVPLSVIAWWWVGDNAEQDLADRGRQVAAQLIAQEDEAGAVPTDLDPGPFRFLAPPEGRLEITYTSADGPSQTLVVGEEIAGAQITETIDLGPAGIIAVSMPEDKVRSDQFAAVGIVVLVVASSIAGGTALAAVTAGRLADPLILLADRAAAMARGDFRTAWPPSGIGEVDRVSRALSDANAEIALRLEREAKITGDVSHQLRSRLTAIGLRLDELSLHEDPAVVAEAEAALEVVDRLAGELDDMVEASRIVAGPSGEVDVAGLAETLAGDFAAAFEAEERRLELRRSGPVVAVTAHPGRLREALSVLIDNARRHGAGTCRVEITGLGGGGLLRISVSDEGAGISDEQADLIFRRGFSGGASSGLGLSLARALVEADGGRLELTARRPPVFTIVLPTRPGAGTTSRPGSVDPVAHR